MSQDGPRDPRPAQRHHVQPRSSDWTPASIHALSCFPSEFFIRASSVPAHARPSCPDRIPPASSAGTRSRTPTDQKSTMAAPGNAALQPQPPDLSRPPPRASFFPRVDAAVLRSKHETPAKRPDTIGPVLDEEHADQPIAPWTPTFDDAAYPAKEDKFAPATVPPQDPTLASERYLPPVLTRNERLRLTMLWYYTRGLFQDAETLSRLQEKSFLAQESSGWEFAIVGLLGMNTYTRLATFGLPLAILPRRESTCAHTVNQPHGTVFLMPNMIEDWRFQSSPHVEIGGLRSYAGVPLRFETDFGDSVAFGSVCVASNSGQDVLSSHQQIALTRLADSIVSDIVQGARLRRQAERRRLVDLIATAQNALDSGGLDDRDGPEAVILRVMRDVYPDALVDLQRPSIPEITIDQTYSVPVFEFEGGLWENIDYIDYVLENLNHQDLPVTKVVRAVTARCDDGGTSKPSYLVVASKDFHLVFDDVDSWFVETCAIMLSQAWNKRLLNEAMKAKETFLRGVTHQLRTPIHGILGSAELLAEMLSPHTSLTNGTGDRILVEAQTTGSFSKHAETSVYINNIQAAGRELNAIVNSTITLNRWADITKSERVATRYTLHQLEAELSDDVARIVAALKPDEKPSVFLTSVFPSHCDSALLNLDLFKESVLPLIQNGIQSTQNGGIVSTALSISTEAKELVVDVRDDGCGIPPEYQDRVFEAYEKVASYSTGAGLGLTLAAKFATLLGGSVELITSEVGHGSHFRATFRGVIASSEAQTQPGAEQPKEIARTLFNASSKSHGAKASLCDHLEEYFSSRGFAKSDCIDKSLVLMDFGQRLAMPAIARDQVVICPIPASANPVPPEGEDANVIYVHGPFTSATLTAALRSANEALARIHNCTLSTDKTEVELGTTVQDNGEPFSASSLPETTAETVNSWLVPSLLATLPVHPKPITPICITSMEPTLPSSPTSPLQPVLPNQLRTPIQLFDPKAPAALLVDDNAINLRILKMYCTRRKIPHYCAADGDEAVKLFREVQSAAAADDQSPGIGLIFMDLQMPVCDGIEATRRIRELESQHQWGRSALFIVTGQDSPVDRAAAVEADADEYHVKPVGMRVLDEGVRRYFPEVGVATTTTMKATAATTVMDKGTMATTTTKTTTTTTI